MNVDDHDEPSSERRHMLRRLADWQRIMWVDQLNLGDLTPDQRALFPAVMRAGIVDLAHRARWNKIGAWLAFAGAGSGAYLLPKAIELLTSLHFR